jgi:Zn-dependent M28 family amino/carboxypeptidase
MSVRRRVLTLVTVTATVAATAVATFAVAVPAQADDPSKKLTKAVTLEGVLRHLSALQSIADARDGTRAAGLTGFDDSAAYVHQRLTRAGYDVQYQEFSFKRFVTNSPTVFERTGAEPFVEDTDYATAEYSGSGDATGTVVPVDVVEPPAAAPSSTSGCEASDFANFPTGSIALLQRGTCEFGLKAANASQAGAAGAIIYNEGQPGRTEMLSPTLGEHPVTIPVVGVSYELGRDLVGDTVHLKTDVSVVTSTTRNVLAQTRTGRTDNVVMLGGHLDSVPEGPGINDNGTGTAALLETAVQLAKTHRKVGNQVRFAFWSAEEAGLLGSNHYVEQLAAAERDKIALYLNFDMVGSPNYFRGVYDGSGSLGGTAPRPEGSAAIENLFNSYFGGRDLPYEDTEFSGRSDYQAFISNGIPAGGLFTGAEGAKTPEQVARYGGVVGAYDPCYHKACDNLRGDGQPAEYTQLKQAYGRQLKGNLNLFALDTSADAIAHATATYARSTESVNGVSGPRRRAQRGNAGGHDHGERRAA